MSTSMVGPAWTTNAPDFRHLRRLTTSEGLYEHCRGSVPRPEHGYCTDDVARALITVVREPELDNELIQMAYSYLDFLWRSQRDGGRFANRRDVTGRWLDDGADDDASGRAVWAIGQAGVHLANPSLRSLARWMFDDACSFRSPWLRSTAFAVLGAAEITSHDPSHPGATRLLSDAAAAVRFGDEGGDWPWPEDRLAYANAVIPEMFMVLGRELGLASFVTEGIRLLDWLVDIQTGPRGWLSVVPTGGWSRGETRPGFDQQPIEVAALADASWTAWSMTRDQRWREVIEQCGAWFLGENDARVPMIDPHTGGGYDGLTPTGANLNQGAESTIAAITTMQRLQLVRGRPARRPHPNVAYDRPVNQWFSVRRSPP